MKNSPLLDRLAQIVGAKHLIDSGDNLSPYIAELRGRYHSECLAVVLPNERAQVVDVVECCAEFNVSVVPQGGNTGTMGGAVARADQIILNLARMNCVLEVDPINYTMDVQAGCILANIQDAAIAHQRFFPLALGAQGSCQIGGNLATNAGGINVLRYGNARDLVLGLEVVLADGRVWNGLNRLRKNNTGYDLKNLFIGSEGTLGIITSATLKLFPLPRDQVVALVGLENPDAALVLLSRLRACSSDCLSTFELMANVAVQSVVEHIDNQTDPLQQQHRWYVLVVASSSADVIDGDATQSTLRQQIEFCFAEMLRENVLQDAVVAANETQAQRLILLRENIVEAQKTLGGSIKHDVSVPVANVPEFLRRAQAAVEDIMPTAICYPFGHMGDGNMHYNISQPATMNPEEFQSHQQKITHQIHEITHHLNGSFSAEHGIGIAKLPEMTQYKDPVSLALYQQIKQTLDPKNLLNPGKLNP